MESLPYNFLGLEEEHSRYEDARFVVLPVPYDSTASYQTGARKGPAAIISASQHLEWFDEELEAECYDCGIATLDAVEPNMAGPEAMHEDLLTKHKKLSILQIDAHCDLRDSYHKSRYSHACVMRRILDLGATIVPVGIRAIAPEDHRFMKRRKIDPITARECHMDDDWLDRALDALSDTVYITLDIDGFDPAYAPGTGAPEPGGLDWYQVTALLRLVTAEKKVVGADIVEVAPIPGQVVTEYLAARLAYKLMGYVQMRA